MGRRWRRVPEEADSIQCRTGGQRVGGYVYEVGDTGAFSAVAWRFGLEMFWRNLDPLFPTVEDARRAVERWLTSKRPTKRKERR